MDKKDLFQIGDVAKMFHLSVGSLRHYEKIGLLKPEYTDKETGYRYYGMQQFEVLTMIRFLRVLDMPLDEIRLFLSDRKIQTTQEMLKKQKKIILQKQTELKLIEQRINRSLAMIDDALSSEVNIITVKHIPQKKVAWLRTSVSPKAYFDLEPSIRALEKDSNDAVVYLGKVGIGIAKDKLTKGIFDEYDMVFITLEQEDSYYGETDIWEETDCVCIRFHGSHRDAPEYYKKLIEFINEHGMCISGFSREITMIDNCITDETDKFVTEVQIPVTYGALPQTLQNFN